MRRWLVANEMALDHAEGLDTHTSFALRHTHLAATTLNDGDVLSISP